MGEAAEQFRAISPAEFFYRYRETAGFANPARAMYQTIRELVENSLDATDTHSILPDVKITIRKVDELQEFYKVTVEDNGVGIPPDVVPNAFGKVLYSSKYVLKQTRGMYGLGGKMAVLYGQVTTGRPVEVITSRPGFKRIYYFRLRIDINKNEPVILERGSWRKQRDWRGTIVSVTIEGDWAKAKARIKEYLFKTAVVTPYANIVMVTPEDEVIYYPRVINKLPPPPREVKPHPHGIDLEVLKRLREIGPGAEAKEFLINNFQSIGEATANLILERTGISPSKKVSELSDEELLNLLNVMKGLEDIRPPSARALSPLGPEIIVAGLKRMFEPEFVHAVTRRPSTYQGQPFIVEVGIAYGGKTPTSEPDKPLILRYANKIPLLYDEGSDVSTIIVKEEISWDNYLITFPAPLAVLIHVCSTKVPFKGVGKESIADVPEIRREIKLALSEALRELRKHLMKKVKEEEQMRKVESIAKYIPEVARDLSLILDNGNEKVMRELVHRLSLIVHGKTGIPLDVINGVTSSVKFGQEA